MTPPVGPKPNFSTQTENLPKPTEDPSPVTNENQDLQLTQPEILINLDFGFPAGILAEGHPSGFVYSGEIGAHDVSSGFGANLIFHRKVDTGSMGYEINDYYNKPTPNGVTYFGVKPALSFGYEKNGYFRLGLPLGLQIRDDQNGAGFFTGLSLEMNTMATTDDGIAFSVGGISLSLLTNPFGENQTIGGLAKFNINPVGLITALTN